MGKPTIITLQHLKVNQGEITIAEDGLELPFKLRRIYWLTDIPNGQVRGNNASLKAERVIVCVRGRVTVNLEDIKGNNYKYELNKPHNGLYIPNLHWTKIKFAESSILFCMVSNRFQESDYIRNYQAFLALANNR